MAEHGNKTSYYVRSGECKRISSLPIHLAVLDLISSASVPADDQAVVDLETGAGWITIWPALKGEAGQQAEEIRRRRGARSFSDSRFAQPPAGE